MLPFSAQVAIKGRSAIAAYRVGAFGKWGLTTRLGAKAVQMSTERGMKNFVLNQVELGIAHSWYRGVQNPIVSSLEMRFQGTKSNISVQGVADAVADAVNTGSFEPINMAHTASFLWAPLQVKHDIVEDALEQTAGPGAAKVYHFVSMFL